MNERDVRMPQRIRVSGYAMNAQAEKQVIIS